MNYLINNTHDNSAKAVEKEVVKIRKQQAQIQTKLNLFNKHQDSKSLMMEEQSQLNINLITVEKMKDRIQAQQHRNNINNLINNTHDNSIRQEA